MEINQKDISKLTDLYLDVIPFITFHTIKQCFYQESHPTKNVVLHSVMGNKYANNDLINNPKMFNGITDDLAAKPYIP